MEKINIVNKNVEDLIPYENNPRNNENAVEYVANSIKEFGFKVPIVIDKDNVVVAGHTRLKASKQLGLKEVPCIIADDLTDEQVKAFRLADNKVSEFSLWDIEKLKTELTQIGGLNEFDEIFNDANIIDILDEEGLNKPKTAGADTFGVSFSVSVEYETFINEFIKEHGKQELNDLFYKVIKGEE